MSFCLRESPRRKQHCRYVTHHYSHASLHAHPYQVTSHHPHHYYLRSHSGRPPHTQHYITINVIIWLISCSLTKKATSLVSLLIIIPSSLHDSSSLGSHHHLRSHFGRPPHTQHYMTISVIIWSISSSLFKTHHHWFAFLSHHVLRVTNIHHLNLDFILGAFLACSSKCLHHHLGQCVFNVTPLYLCCHTSCLGLHHCHHHS